MQTQQFWSERIIFGTMIIGGYMLVVGTVVFFGKDMDPDQRQIIRDSLLALGPLLGMIVQAMFRTDKAEKDMASAARTLAEKAPTHSSNSPGGTDGPFDATITPIPGSSEPVVDGGTEMGQPTPPDAAPRPAFLKGR